MSASPADRTPGGGEDKKRRKPAKPADPLVRPKAKRPAQPAPPTNGYRPQQPNGSSFDTYGGAQYGGPPPSKPAPPSLRLRPKGPESARSGFSSAPVAPFVDYPLVMSKRALFEGFRHHVARFAGKKNVDPRNPEEFVRPVRLHRRDPRFRSAGIKDEDQMMGNAEDNKEAEMRAIAKVERDARREAENALVAPSLVGTHKKLGTNLKKTEQVYRNDLTEEQKARTKLRYEEALPWHLEDFENKNTWAGTYEAALSDTYAMMVRGPNGEFYMTPLEKWYKFTQKNQFKTLTIEEAEMRFNKKVKEPRWFMDTEEAKRKRETEGEDRKAGKGLFLGKWEKGGGGSGVAAPAVKPESADADDLDFQEDRFADDEENMLFEEDDETKEAEERIKRDQLQANVFDLKEEKDYEKQEQLERKEKEAEKKLGKRVKKALMKREKNYIYDSDSGSNPYSSSSESESSSSETARQKAAENDKDKANKTSPKSSPEKPHHHKHKSAKPASGASTPRLHHAKTSHTLSRPASTTNLKRPGSPLASDASGNESSRRKAKKNKHLHPTQPQPKPSSRPISPAIPSSSAPQQTGKRARGAGSGSDSEGGGGGSGGEMSDGTRKRQKLRLTLASKNGSPTGSRAGSPGVGGNANAPPPPRPTSPINHTMIALTAAQVDLSDLPTIEEIRLKIPREGIKMGDLLNGFRGRVNGDERRAVFTRLMKSAAKFDKGSRLLMPL